MTKVEIGIFEFDGSKIIVKFEPTKEVLNELKKIVRDNVDTLK